VSIDNIRRQAKFNAWYTDPNEEPSGFIKNPFTKYRAPTNSTTNSRTNTLDAQEKGKSGLRRTSTDHFGGRNLRTNTLNAQEKGNNGLRRTSTDHFGGRNRRQDLLEFQPTLRREIAPNADLRIDQSRGFNTDLVRRSAGPIQEEQEQVSTELDEKAAKDSQSSEIVAIEEEKPAHQHPQDLVHGTHGDNGNANEANGGDDNNGKEKTQKKFTLMSQIRGTILNSPINILLLFCELICLEAVLFLLMPDSTRRNCTLLCSR